jgi:two-component system sensor histidine kinase/response regulator
VEPRLLLRALAPYVPAPVPVPMPAQALPPPELDPLPPPVPVAWARLPWPAWPGMDVEDALRRYASELLVRDGLAGFAEHYAQHAGQLSALAAAHNVEGLSREAHTLKGLARQFGMTAVADAAVALEEALAGRPNFAAAATALSRLVQALEEVLQALRAHPPWPAPGDAPGDPRRWARLALLLAEGDDEALAHWQHHRGALMAALPDAPAQALDDALQRNDFVAALNLLGANEPVLEPIPGANEPVAEPACT